MTIKTSSEILKDHFEKLKELVPEVYQSSQLEHENIEDKLYSLLKRTLTIVEAVYFQDKDMFHAARIEEYGHVIHDLRQLGFDYPANRELVQKAAATALMKAKLPMEKAKGAKRKDKTAKKAG